MWPERPTMKAVRIHNIRREYPRICSLQSLVLGLNGLNSFVDIVLILVSQSANLHLCDLCVQLILSRVALPTAWRLRCQEWKELNYDFSKSVENRDFWPNGKNKQTMK